MASSAIDAMFARFKYLSVQSFLINALHNEYTPFSPIKLKERFKWLNILWLVDRKLANRVAQSSVISLWERFKWVKLDSPRFWTKCWTPSSVILFRPKRSFLILDSDFNKVRHKHFTLWSVILFPSISNVTRSLMAWTNSPISLQFLRPM